MKDPAFLFYPNDYLGGTIGLTLEQKGAYMELLMMQFNRGHMTSHMIAHVLGHRYEYIWYSIQEKFKIDENGMYYNERLEIEQNKRKSYSDSRKKNILGKNQHSKKEKKSPENSNKILGHMTSHMEDENIIKYNNINTNTNITPDFSNLYIIPIDVLEQYMISDEKWVEDIARINKLGITYESSIIKAKEWIHLFVDKLRADNVKEENKNTCFKYCNNWIKQEINNGQKFNKSSKTGIKESEYDGSYAKKRPITSAI